MKKFFQSGAAFMVVAVLCLAAGVLSFAAGKNGAVFTAVGAFWLVMAEGVRAKSRKPPTYSAGNVAGRSDEAARFKK